MWELVLFFVGIALQLGGVVLTIIGARTVWRDIASPDDRFLAPFIRAGQWIDSKWRRLLRLLGLRGHTQVLIGQAAEISVIAGDLRVTRSFAQLRDDLTTQQALQTLDDRIREVQALAYDQAYEVEQRIKKAVEELAAEQVRAQQDAEAVAKRERRTAVQGLRLEAYGFAFLTAGTLVQAIGSYLGIEPLLLP